MVGYLLVQQAQIAAGRLAARGLADAERAFYTGKVSVATYFASTVLPELPARLATVKNAQDGLWQASVSSF
jgi:hypothetical protein